MSNFSKPRSRFPALLKKILLVVGDKVLDYALGGKTYEAVFGKSEREIYDNWGQYLKD